MEKLNKKITMLLLFVFLIALPMPSDTVSAQSRGGLLINDGCKFAKSAAFFAGMNAFAFGLMPPFQPVGVAFGIVALGAKTYDFIYC